MLKKIYCAVAVLFSLATSAFAITPDTSSMYDKIAEVSLLDISEASPIAVYIIIGLLVVFVAIGFLNDRRTRRRIQAAKEEAEKNREE